MLLFMFVHICKIYIGLLEFDYANRITIDTNLDNVVQGCSIFQPRRAKFGDSDVNVKINKGDKVVVQLGYRDDFGSDNLGLFTEFVGYVSNEGIGTPVEIVCEDEMFNLKKGNINKRYPNGVKLSQLIKDVAPGYNYEIDDITLGAYVIENATPVQVFKDLTQQGIPVYFIPPTAWPYNGKADYTPTLRAGRQYRSQYRRVLMKGGRNGNAELDALRWQFADNTGIVIKAVSNQKGRGKLVEYYPPTADRNNSNLYSRNFSHVDAATLKRLAEQEYLTYAREGYIGSVKTLGVPLITMGDEGRIENPEYPANDAEYIIDAVRTEFSYNGFNRVSTIGGKATNIKRK
jgi:hypothetical protein